MSVSSPVLNHPEIAGPGAAYVNSVIDVVADVMQTRGVPEHIRSNNHGPEMVATKLREWLDKLGTKTPYIAPGSRWENGYCEIFYTLREAQVLIAQWRRHYDRVRPHSALGYRPPAPGARGPALVPRKTVQHQRAA
jgi:putative transposase